MKITIRKRQNSYEFFRVRNNIFFCSKDLLQKLALNLILFFVIANEQKVVYILLSLSIIKN